jgi:hypothetical protein
MTSFTKGRGFSWSHPLFDLYQAASVHKVFVHTAVHGYRTAVCYPDKIAANSLTAAKSDLISYVTLKLKPTPFEITRSRFVAVCLGSRRT